MPHQHCLEERMYKVTEQSQFEGLWTQEGSLRLVDRAGKPVVSFLTAQELTVFSETHESFEVETITLARED